ncbi:MAG: FtsQ-type POTRA domain-containing protein [Burkholderia sp.]|nr:FtsQ-type POTRA domain-containing protein [Burkholderia sp.]
MWNNVQQLNLAAIALRVLFILSLAVTGLIYLIRYQAFAIQTIRIVGDTTHVKLQIVKDNVVRKIKGNFFTIDLGIVQRDFEKMPWIHRASVRRIWPNALLITLEEYKPLSIWGTNDHSNRIVSIDGDIFTVNRDEFKGKLPLLYGPENSVKDIVAHYYNFKQWFAYLNLKPKKIILSPRYAWSIDLSNGMHVEVGKEKDNKLFLNYIMYRLISAWPIVIERWGNNIKYVDLRYSNGFVILYDNNIFIPGRYIPKEVVARTSKSAL